MEEEFKNDFRSRMKKIENFKELEDKMDQVMEELKSLQVNLTTPEMFESIKNTSNLDSESLIDCFDNEVEEAISKVDLMPTTFVFNNNFFANFDQELRKIVRVE